MHSYSAVFNPNVILSRLNGRLIPKWSIKAQALQMHVDVVKNEQTTAVLLAVRHGISMSRQSTKLLLQ